MFWYSFRLFIILILIQQHRSVGQNLVPNPSFEDTLLCPGFTNGNLISLCENWYESRNSPNYFHECHEDSFPLFDTPLNGFGFQIPRSGKAYGGLYTYGNPSGLSQNYREFIYTELINPLQIGTKYFVKFYVSRATNGFYYPMNWATDKIGILLTLNLYLSQNSDPLPNISHVSANNVVIDTINWVAISGSFVADSNYQYLNIGNFYDSTFTIAQSIGPTPTLGAYYFIDDVCISTDSLTCNPPVGISQIENNVELILFPNPTSGEINIPTKFIGYEVKIHDLTGRIVYKNSSIQSVSMDLGYLPPGCFIVNLSKGDKVYRAILIRQ